MMLNIADTGQSIESFIEEKELYGILQSAIEQLDDTYRSVLELKLLFYLKETEISKILNISKSAVNVRIYRGKKLLQSILKQYLDN